MTAMLFRLAFAGIRSRLLASALTIAIAAAAVATIVLALEVRSSGVDPWQRTFDEANGAHVLAFVPSQADARAIGELPGVTERGAPVPLVSATVGPRGSTDQVQLAGLSGRTAVNMPVLTAGSQLREGGIVLERSLADALGIEVGATLAVDEQTRLDRASGSRDGGRSQPAALPAPQTRPGLGHPGHARTDRTRSRPLALVGGGAAGGSLRGCGVRRAGGGRLPAAVAVRASLLRDLARPARQRAGRCTRHAGDRHDVHHPAPDRRLRRRRDPRRRPRQRTTPSDRAAEGGRLHPAPGRSRLRARVRRARSRRGRPRLRARGDPCAPPCRTQRRNAARLADDRGESLAHPRRELCRPSRAPGRSLDVHPPQHSLHRPRGDPCGQLVSRRIHAWRAPSPDPSCR